MSIRVNFQENDEFLAKLHTFTLVVTENNRGKKVLFNQTIDENFRLALSSDIECKVVLSVVESDMECFKLSAGQSPDVNFTFDRHAKKRSIITTLKPKDNLVLDVAVATIDIVPPRAVVDLVSFGVENAFTVFVRDRQRVVLSGASSLTGGIVWKEKSFKLSKIGRHVFSVVQKQENVRGLITSTEQHTFVVDVEKEVTGNLKCVVDRSNEPLRFQIAEIAFVDANFVSFDVLGEGTFTIDVGGHVTSDVSDVTGFTRISRAVNLERGKQTTVILRKEDCDVWYEIVLDCLSENNNDLVNLERSIVNKFNGDERVDTTGFSFDILFNFEHAEMQNVAPLFLARGMPSLMNMPQSRPMLLSREMPQPMNPIRFTKSSGGFIAASLISLIFVGLF